jgi:hypothetical protein
MSRRLEEVREERMVHTAASTIVKLAARERQGSNS